MPLFGGFSIASYPEVSQASTGGPSFPEYANVNESPTQTLPNSPLRLGQYLGDKFGNIFQMVRARTALAVGKVVKLAANVAGTAITADATGDGLHVIKTDLAGLTKNSEVGNLFLIAGQIPRVIKANTATAAGVAYITVSDKNFGLGISQYDGDAYASVIANATVVHVARLYSVGEAGVGDTPFGVALGTVTDGNVTLVQVAGVGSVSSVGTTDALTQGGIVVTAATGDVKGTLAVATAASAIAEAKSIVGVARFPHAGAAALVAVQLLMFGRQ